MSGVGDDDLDRIERMAYYGAPERDVRALVGEVRALRRRNRELEDERDDLRKLAVFGDGAAVTGIGLGLADLYAPDCEWAQTRLRDAGCHPRGAEHVALPPLGRRDDRD